MRSVALVMAMALSGCTVVGAVGGGLLGHSGGNGAQDAVIGGAVGLVVDIIVLVKFFGDPDKTSSSSTGRTKSGMFPSLY
jgi:hypothetical protein